VGILDRLRAKPAPQAQQAARGGYAVVDLETTGLSPRTNRIVEVAVVALDPWLRPQGEFVTLVNPGRDVGPTSIHGLTASDVSHAPSFADMASGLERWLGGRVLVAHNIRFDVAFLAAEFARLGATIPSVPALCTMELASAYLPHAYSRCLPDCCDAAGVPHPDAHQALADARAVAGLLTSYARSTPVMPASWGQALTLAANTPWPALPATAGQPVTRATVAAAKAQEVPYLVRLVRSLPRAATDPTWEPYLAVLDGALEDRLVTDAEAAQLADVAHALGLTAEAAAAAHRTYLDHVAVAALADGTVTPAERADLDQVARLLGYASADVEHALNTARTDKSSGITPRRPLHVGDIVVFTGECHQPREQMITAAAGAGLTVRNSVSRKTALLVTADPISQSGKARAARELGVRTVTEAVFESLLANIHPEPRVAEPRTPHPRPRRAASEQTLAE
jgi:DNA polymerase-3 subunit epsilon